MEHYDAIRAVPAFRSSTICYIFENNLGKEHDHLTTIVTETAHMDNVTVLSEHLEVIGFHTSAPSRLRADDRLQDKISSGGVCFDANLISINPDLSRAGENAKATLLTQIADMREYTKALPNGKYQRVVTSLFSEDFVRIRGKQDDMQRALAMLLYAESMFRAGKLPVDYREIYALRENRRLSSMWGAPLKKTMAQARRDREADEARQSHALLGRREFGFSDN